LQFIAELYFYIFRGFYFCFFADYRWFVWAEGFALLIDGFVDASLKLFGLLGDHYNLVEQDSNSLLPWFLKLS
jgi:hypothetical protein